MSINADCDKVMSVIASCLNKDQLNVADKMINLFDKKYANETDLYACQKDISVQRRGLYDYYGYMISLHPSKKQTAFMHSVHAAIFKIKDEKEKAKANP